MKSPLLEFFLVRPGDGEEFVFSPVEVNATIHCAVNNTNLFWDVDHLSFAELGSALNSRGIFQRTNTSSDGMTTSNLTVFGNIEMNSNIRICCRSLVGVKVRGVCTTLIIYGMVHVFSKCSL